MRTRGRLVQVHKESLRAHSSVRAGREGEQTHLDHVLRRGRAVLGEADQRAAAKRLDKLRQRELRAICSHGQTRQRQ